ncbi:MAG: hypothetical protein K0Q55_3293 [Verrucomicrobia bacterium]|jgi:hypothetical protein|nr:hypothetical protein [Verrucomicrobiota bacterium]
MKLTEQSEMKVGTGCQPVSRRYRRISQANWWFGQMRRAVEQACPSEVTRVRVEQRVLPLAEGN